MTLKRSLTGRPHSLSRSYQPDWVSGAPSRLPSSLGPAAAPLIPPPAPAEPTTRPIPCTIASSAREAVTRGSFCRSEPAAALRGLAKAGLPASCSEELSRSNAASGRNTSPRTSSTSGSPSPASRAGIDRIVLTFGVTSSPVRPSPRVAALVSRPRS